MPDIFCLIVSLHKIDFKGLTVEIFQTLLKTTLLFFTSQSICLHLSNAITRYKLLILVLHKVLDEEKCVTKSFFHGSL